MGLVGVCLRPVLYPFDDELLDEGMHQPTTCRHSENKERRVGNGERAPPLAFRPLDCVGEVFSYMACYILQIGAGARINDGSVKQKRLILASRVVVEEWPRLRCYVHM